MGTTSVAGFVSVFLVLSQQAFGARVASTIMNGYGKLYLGNRVFSDLDDTLKCSLGGVAGMDTNCDHHGEIYPGALNFALELGRGPREGEIAAPPKAVPLSARPEELRFLLGIKDSDPLNIAFQKVASSENASAWGLDLAGAQYGSLMNALSVFQSRFEAGLSQKKFNGWLAYNASEPTFFLADNGQGDVKAAEMMVSRQNDHLFQSIDGDSDGRINESEFIHFSTTGASLPAHGDGHSWSPNVSPWSPSDSWLWSPSISHTVHTAAHARQVFRQEVYRSYPD